MKGGHAEEGSEHREKQREDLGRKLEKQKNYIYFKEKTDCDISSDPSINVRLNLFTFTEVNLVLGRPCSTNYIIWAF